MFELGIDRSSKPIFGLSGLDPSTSQSIVRQYALSLYSLGCSVSSQFPALLSIEALIESFVEREPLFWADQSGIANEGSLFYQQCHTLYRWLFDTIETKESDEKSVECLLDIAMALVSSRAEDSTRPYALVRLTGKPSFGITLNEDGKTVDVWDLEDEAVFENYVEGGLNCLPESR